MSGPEAHSFYLEFQDMTVYIVSSNSHFDNYIDLLNELDVEWYFLYKRPRLIRIKFAISEDNIFNYKEVKQILKKHGINCKRRTHERTFDVSEQSDFVLQLLFSTQEIIKLQ